MGRPGLLPPGTQDKDRAGAPPQSQSSRHWPSPTSAGSPPWLLEEEAPLGNGDPRPSHAEPQQAGPGLSCLSLRHTRVAALGICTGGPSGHREVQPQPQRTAPTLAARPSPARPHLSPGGLQPPGWPSLAPQQRGSPGTRIRSRPRHLRGCPSLPRTLTPLCVSRSCSRSGRFCPSNRLAQRWPTADVQDGQLNRSQWPEIRALLIVQRPLAAPGLSFPV